MFGGSGSVASDSLVGVVSIAMTLAFLGLPSDLPDELVLELFSLTKFLVKSEIRDSIPDSLRHYGFFFFLFKQWYACAGGDKCVSDYPRTTYP